MIDFIYILLGFMGAIKAYSYARWLRQNGNTGGAAGVFFVGLISLVLPVYRMLRQ
ncbi:Hypothetical protein LUCI_2919 [Lucifera butyrica]|uniref:Uncharacterized protein n=1 Tax=Lucifera butyrica TaxID=1351585 RepID=A0A498R815_9FIRM|nr:hypothetical protein [Lucifera butyrica]VBB07654.1 Hypothetical protein LUCI_2919 [Lucifera butyrica]